MYSKSWEALWESDSKCMAQYNSYSNNDISFVVGWILGYTFKIRGGFFRKGVVQNALQ